MFDIGRLKGRRAAVIGDVALDAAFFSEPSEESSVETALPVNHVKSSSFSPGASANLAVNIATLGLGCDLYGFAGDDPAAEILEDLLESHGVESMFVKPEGFQTFVYGKIYDESMEECPRYDTGAGNIYADEDIDTLLDMFRSRLSRYQVIIINQQFSNTLHSRYFQARMAGILRDIRIPVWFDARSDLSYPNASCKLNESECRNLFGSDDIQGNLKALYERLENSNEVPHYAVMTRGKEGAAAYDGTDFFFEPGVFDLQETDAVGAGDSFLAMLAACEALGDIPLPEMIRLANLAATVSVRTLHGCGHPTWQQVEELGSDTDYRYNPELASDIRKASYIEGTDIEVINHSFRPRPFPKVAIFDHDGTISTMRQGWEAVMRKMMAEAICGDRIGTLPAAVVDKVYRAVDAMIEKTTGIQTILQMVQLVSLIKSFGFVPDQDIRTPLEYKEIYKKRLSDMIRHKYELFDRGIYTAADLTMKSSLEFLRFLRERGTTVYLASGSDYDDVRYEMDKLGYSDMYTGGIFGSVGDISQDPKKMVMSRIVHEICNGSENISPSQIAVFGDGPVEMREGRKRGFITIGVASDEKQRFGLNPAKRERIVLAGADFIIPDFSWMPLLCDYLGWK